MDFNILANIHREKCLIFYSQKDLSSAIIEIEKALQAILLMDKPYQFEVVMLYETQANLYIES